LNHNGCLAVVAGPPHEPHSDINGLGRVVVDSGPIAILLAFLEAVRCFCHSWNTRQYGNYGLVCQALFFDQLIEWPLAGRIAAFRAGVPFCIFLYLLDKIGSRLWFLALCRVVGQQSPLFQCPLGAIPYRASFADVLIAFSRLSSASLGVGLVDVGVHHGTQVFQPIEEAFYLP